MKRFKGIYWRQFGISAGLVALTLVLLGTSFFTLTYTYLLSEKKEELEDKAGIMAVKGPDLLRVSIAKSRKRRLRSSAIMRRIVRAIQTPSRSMAWSRAMPWAETASSSGASGSASASSSRIFTSGPSPSSPSGRPGFSRAMAS